MTTPKDACEKFNATYPVGTDVFLRKDNGTLVSTKTRSTAGVLNDREAVIWLEGIGGCYLLDRVTPFDQVLRLSRRRTMDPMMDKLPILNGMPSQRGWIDLDGLSQAQIDVIEERGRQVDEEGFVEARDDLYIDGELSLAAFCYAICGLGAEPPFGDREGSLVRAFWPWEAKWWKPKTRREDLVRAAALLVADIERLDRAEQRS